MQTKICNKCNVEQDIQNFRIYNKKNKKYIQTICKQCERLNMNNYKEKHKKEIAEYKKQYAIKNEDKIKKYKEKYYNDNKDKVKQQHRNYYLKNKKEILEKNKKYRNNNLQKYKQKNKIYYNKHKEEIILKTSEYKNKKLKEDEVYKIKCQARHLIGLSFARKGLIKSKKTEEIVGISLEKLYIYLIQTFKNNYGYEWDGKESVHIDHIIPLATANTQQEVIKLCHYTNLQLLKAEDNLKKNDKINYKIGGNILC